jgi:hypothetical protein
MEAPKNNTERAQQINKFSMGMVPDSFLRHESTESVTFPGAFTPEESDRPTSILHRTIA